MKKNAWIPWVIGGVSILLVCFLFFKQQSKQQAKNDELAALLQDKSESSESLSSVALEEISDSSILQNSTTPTPSITSESVESTKEVVSLEDNEVPYDYKYAVDDEEFQMEYVLYDSLPPALTDWVSSQAMESGTFDKKTDGYTYLLIANNEKHKDESIIVDSIEEMDNYISVSYHFEATDEAVSSPNYTLIRINRLKDIRFNCQEDSTETISKTTEYNLISDVSTLSSSIKSFLRENKEKKGVYQYKTNKETYVLISLGKQTQLGNYIDLSYVKESMDSILLGYQAVINNFAQAEPDPDTEAVAQEPYYPYLLFSFTTTEKEIIATETETEQ